MFDYPLNPRQLAERRAAHRAALNVGEAYRLTAVILLAEGWTAAPVGQALLLDPHAVRTYFKRYQQGGLAELLRLSFIGSEALLAAAEWCELDAHRHLQRHLTVASVGQSVLVSAIP